jgi:cyclic-di-AMP phosphodiesterase PgpH
MGKSEPTLFEKLETESEKEASEELSASGEGWRYSLWGRVGIIVATMLVTTLFFPLSRSMYDQFRIGVEWQQEPVIAETTFPIYKPKDQYLREVQAAQDQTLFVFTLRADSENLLKNIRSLDQTITNVLNEQNGVETSSEAVSEAQRLTGISSDNLTNLASMSEVRRTQKLRHVAEVLAQFQVQAYKRGFISIPRAVFRNRTISVHRSPSEEQVYSIENLLDSASYKVKFDEVVRQNLDDTEGALAKDFLPLLLQPNLLYSAPITEEMLSLAEESVPKTLGLVRKGETMIAKGDVITSETLAKLQSSAYTRFLSAGKNQGWLAFWTNLLHVALIYSLVLVYLFIIRKKLFFDNAQLAGMSVMFVAVGLFAWLVGLIESQLPLQYFILIPAVSMLVAIIYDSRTTSITTIAFALLAAAIRGRDYEIALAMVLAGTFAGYTVRDLRNRTQLFQSMGFIAIGYCVPALMFAVRYSTPLATFGLQILFASMSAVLCPIITFGVLFLTERMFNITSDLRLVEYDNINHPLLTELNEKAPGTYQHSLMVARLAEGAALAIEANPILVKVGALFHDIGKMRKAEYFVENQINIANKHDKIAPLKSASIIRQHVGEGMLLGKAYKLPQRIMDFIPMHHGTMLIRYFYAKALDEAAEKSMDKNEINEDNFRYPGPRPNSKETGILMLADAVEATSHTIDTNDRDELEEVIDSIFAERILDKQLDECDLSMQELVLIKESFVRNLLGAGHQRVKYKPLPKDDEDVKTELTQTQL